MKKKIALVTGGYSGEATISYRSARTIFDNLDKEKFEVYTIDINPKGWAWLKDDGEKVPVDRGNFTIPYEGKNISFDLAYIMLHGTPGEDGKLQGYFDMLGLAYTSCDAAVSALTFNKRYTVAVASMSGIKVARSIHLFKQGDHNTNAILTELHLPLFVKPNNGGSSIGMSKVNEAGELSPALEKAFKEDNQVLVEEMIKGREFTVGVFRSKNKLSVLPITEVISHKDFFDFEAKYEGKSSEVTPADIPAEWKQSLEAAAKKIYEVFNCRGVVRIDFIYDVAANAPFMLEINTVPGQSEASVIPQQVQAAGISLKDFYSTLAEEAMVS
jgi:D-alanine-D-alanine ligase